VGGDFKLSTPATFQISTAQARLSKQPKGSLHIPILKKELEELQIARDQERTTFIADRLKVIPR
jgi:hypothetical protein